MSSNVLEFPRDRTPDEALEENKGAFVNVLIIGVSDDGTITTDGAGDMNPIYALGLVEMLKHMLMATEDD